MEAFPPSEQGFAMAIWGMGMMGAPVFGPALGGWITDNYSWRWIYYVNLPFGLIAVALQAAFIPDSPHQRRPPMVDYFGFLLVALSIGCAQIVLDRGERADWFVAPWVSLFTVTSITAIGLLVWWEQRVAHPVVDLSLFRYPAFTGACVMSMLLCFTLFGNLVTWPLYLQQVMGYTALTAGQAMAPRGMAMVAIMLVIGRLYGKVDIRFVILTGFLLVTYGTYEMSQFTTESTFWGMVWASLVTGIGSGLSFVPLSAIALGSVPSEKLASASGLYNLMRNTGGSAGIAVASTFLLHRAQLHQATLVEHVYVTNPAFQRALGHATDMATAAGTAPGAAEQTATGMIYRLIQLQAAVLSFEDVFLVLTVFTIATLPFLLMLGNARVKAAAGGH
jgi:DHA2 family multidrug resistance protein